MSNELYHWGIKGQRWGIRRYQNKDGTLTPAGKKRSKDDDMSEDAKEAKSISKKKISQMSNAELRKLNDRQNLERNQRQLNKGTIAKGLAAAGTTLAIANTIINITDKGGKVVDIGKSFGGKVLDTIGNYVMKDFKGF